MILTVGTTVLATLLVLAPTTQQASQPASAQAAEALFTAARAGDLAGVRRALDAGAEVNARARYDLTALAMAAGRGHIEVMRLLIDRGADLDVRDTFYGMRALDMALMENHLPAARLLLEKGSKGAGNALLAGTRAGDATLVRAALESPEITRANLTSALALAKQGGRAELAELLAARLKELPEDATPAVSIARATLQSYEGSYRNEGAGVTLTVALKGDQLVASVPGQPPVTLVATSESSFRAAEFEGLTMSFAGRGGMIERVLVGQGPSTTSFERVTAATAAATPVPPAPRTPAARSATAETPRGAPRPWPAFRGENASGNADGQGAVTEWDVASGRNVRWKTAVPGVATSSPIVWGNRVFVTTAISSAGDSTFRTGLYGDVKPVDDLSEHAWKLYALDRTTGQIVWEQTAHTGVPKVKRHTKSSQANSTPVTDGRHIVAVFGSIGLLAAWDFDGKLLWKHDIGAVDSGWFFDADVQWGHSSSPIIYRDMVIVQADQQKSSFLAAFDLATGKEVWRTERDEISTWGTPTLLSHQGRDEIVTNGTKIRGYDPATGKLLWTLGPNSEITVGTPVTGAGLVFVTGGYPPVRPIYAIRPGTRGDISLQKDQTSSEAIAWSNEREGTYIPTPLYYDGLLYTLNNNGILTAYEAGSGERVYRSRVGGGGNAFSASPVAADGRLYLANEDGDVYVILAGRTYEELAKNEMKEVIMATPAISDGLIVVRTLGHVYGIGR